MGDILLFVVVGFAAFIFAIGLLIMIVKFYRKVEQGKALIINKMGDNLKVTFTGGVVIPIINKGEIMDISVKAMEIERTGKWGLICEDNIRADIRVTFYVRVNKTQEDVLKVAQSVGCLRACTKETLEELFQAKFSEGLKTVGKQMDFSNLFTERELFKKRIIETIGEDLNGYKLEDVAIDYLEQTPLNSLDPDNIMDAQGIRKIVDKTAEQAKFTNELKRDKERVIKRQDVETREKILELERQEADAVAKQEREIATIQAREKAEAEKVEAEEQFKSESAQIKTDEELAIANENKDRQIEVAKKAKERTIAVETERVQRDTELEAVERERLVAIKDIEKDKALEVEKKKIQDVIRERVMVEKTVATEQEKIKDTVEFAGAERLRKVEVIEAEREAEKLKIKETKAAQAKEEAAKSIYEETVTNAEGAKIEAEKSADAKKLMAEGIIAEESASGLASVKVREAEAHAIELEGKANATADIEAHKANAFGTEQDGLADAKATDARAKVKAEATKIQGSAEANAMAANYAAEAEGITKKADAMKKLDGVGKEHEEFKLKLAKQEKVELAGIDVNRLIAEAQAEVLGEAMKTAKIDIVGGDGEFLKTFFKSISLGKSVDGFVNNSDVANTFLLGDEETGQVGVLKQFSDALSSEGINLGNLKDLSVAALLAKLALSNNPLISDKAKSFQPKAEGMEMKDLMTLWMTSNI